MKGSVYKRSGSPYWYISYYIPHRVKPITISSKTTVRRDAERLRAKREQEAWEGNYFPERLRGKVTLDKIVDEWLAQHRTDKSYKDHASKARRILKFYGPILVDTMDVPAILALRDKLLERGKKPATVNRYLAALKGIFGYAHANHRILSNPAKQVKMLRENNMRDRLCTREELIRLLVHADEPMRLAIIIAYSLGLRLGNIIGLTHDEVRLGFSPHRIKIPGSKMKNGQPLEIPFTDTILKELTAFSSQATLGDRIFGDVTQVEFSKRFRKLCAKADVKGLRFHDLRHTFATNARHAGADLLTLSELLGHTDLKSLKRYYRVSIADKFEIVKELDLDRA